jgi:hypothetical protein
MIGAAFVFDQVTELAFQEIWHGIAQAEISDFMDRLDYPPHLTLLMAENGDFNLMRSALAYYASQQMPVEIKFPSIGIFPGENHVVFYSPTFTKSLSDLHDIFWRSLIPCVQGGSPLDQPGKWVPHVTVGFGLNDKQTELTISYLSTVSLPKKSRITGVIFGDFQPRGESCLERIDFHI